ncbi:hypothetical protein ACFQX6_47345 [Streptosporangium lutulentum]
MPRPRCWTPAPRACRGGAPAAAEGIGGQPLALVELPLASQGQRDEGTLLAWLPLTNRLERAFTARVSGLPPVTRTLLLVAALNDGTSLAETLNATSVLVGAPVTVADVTPATTVRLVTVDEAGLLFRHPLMRSAIRQSSSLSQRHTAHAALAHVLADRPERCIWHRAASSPGPDEGIASKLEAAATHEYRRGAITTAAAALEHAARLSDDPARRAERLLRAAEHGVELGRPDVVVRLLRETEPLELSPRQRARMVWIRATFDDGIRDDSAGVPSLTEVAERAAADGDPGLALKLLGIAALRCFWAQPGPEVRQRVVTTAESLPVDEHNAQLLTIFAYAAPLDRGAAVIERLRRSAAGPAGDSQAVRLLGSTAILVGDFDLAEALSSASLTDLRAQGARAPGAGTRRAGVERGPPGRSERGHPGRRGGVGWHVRRLSRSCTPSSRPRGPCSPRCAASMTAWRSSRPKPSGRACPSAPARCWPPYSSHVGSPSSGADAIPPPTST